MADSSTNVGIDIFISHSSKDNEIAGAICRILVEEKISYWIDFEQLKDLSEEWREEILSQGIDPASLIMVLVSPDSAASKWVRNEVAASSYRNKRFLVVMVAGDETHIPLDVIRLGRIDLRNGLTDAAKAKLLKAIRTVLNKPVPNVPESEPPDKDKGEVSDANPFRVETVILNDLLLENVARLATQSSDRIWRSALIWFQKDDWYVTAATPGYSDDQLRLRLKNGQGIAGDIWANKPSESYAYEYPNAHDSNWLIEHYKFDQSDPKIAREQVQIIRRMDAIISFPIFSSNTKEMIGIVSLDTPKDVDRAFDISNPPLDLDILTNINLIISNMESSGDYTALSYQSYTGLRHILRVARLLPPLETPVRAGIYWEHTERRELYMITSSEREKTAWSTKPSTFRQSGAADHPIRKAWQDKTLQTTFKDGIETVAIPIRRSPKARVMGILTLEWDNKEEPHKKQWSSAHQQTLENLARLAAKVLEARSRPWHDGLGS